MADPVNISTLIAGCAAAMPDRPAVIHRGRSFTFRELEADVALLAAGLARAGIKPGMRAALMGVSEGGPLCSLFATTYPTRTLALVMIGTYAKRLWALISLELWARRHLDAVHPARACA